jgi:hypothetical protein
MKNLSIILYTDILPKKQENFSWYINNHLKNIPRRFRKNIEVHIRTFWEELAVNPWQTTQTAIENIARNLNTEINIACLNQEPFIEDVIDSFAAGESLLFIPLFLLKDQRGTFFQFFNRFLKIRRRRYNYFYTGGDSFLPLFLSEYVKTYSTGNSYSLFQNCYFDNGKLRHSAITHPLTDEFILKTILPDASIRRTVKQKKNEVVSVLNPFSAMGFIPWLTSVILREKYLIRAESGNPVFKEPAYFALLEKTIISELEWYGKTGEENLL